MSVEGQKLPLISDSRAGRSRNISSATSHKSAKLGGVYMSKDSKLKFNEVNNQFQTQEGFINGDSIYQKEEPMPQEIKTLSERK